ncbi:MAG TPA: hypothetical protein VKE69_13825 [Planctomycetota bacterium]|nr:hypothetical protein [Planctomycetota bacterium]
MTRAPLAVALVALSLSTPAFAQSAHPIAGVSTTDFGHGAGPLGPTSLAVGFDAASGSLQIAVDGPEDGSGSIWQHALLYGISPDIEMALPSPPWTTDAVLYFVPMDALGPFDGKESSIPIPPNPALVGVTLQLQALPIYAMIVVDSATIDPPLLPSLGMTQEVRVTFL